jgi:uncharacterized protein YndB with AHSA1/START domain
MHVEPDLFAQWFGPKGFSATSIDFDLRVGGRYRITMQPPNADAFVLFGEFREIHRGARLAYTFRYEPPTPTIATRLLRCRLGIWARRLG